MKRAKDPKPDKLKVYQQTDNTISFTNGKASITSDMWLDLDNCR
jgi:hypothetical protein